MRVWGRGASRGREGGRGYQPVTIHIGRRTLIAQVEKDANVLLARFGVSVSLDGDLALVEELEEGDGEEEDDEA
ncbi:MAG TPA: hypothetical protein VGK67_36040 [Myxococcales bacterium]